jgi:Putative Ig domain
MAHPVWTTPAGSLGLVPENEFFQVQLRATDPAGGAVTFKSLAGKLPPGIRVTSLGILQGSPIITDTVNTNRKYEFSVRAQDSHGLVADRTFSLTISNIIPPQITPKVSNLGSVFDGGYYSKQLTAFEVNPYATLTWSLANGDLPSGMTLSTGGLLSGFLNPIPNEGNNGATGFAATPFNEFGYENSPIYKNTTYTFTVKVYDGIGYDSFTYSIKVLAKGNFRADSSYYTADMSLTIDNDGLYLPIMTTPSQSLPVARSSSRFAFQFEAYDPNQYPLSYTLGTSGANGFDQDSTVGFDTSGFDQQSLSLPTGLTLDATSGWLTGNISYQAAATQTYNFNVNAYETEFPTYTSKTVQYSLTVLGDVNNTITWTTAASLGVIDNGAVSQFSVTATSQAGKTLTYSLLTGKSHLPQGLKLLSNGLIVGRASFEYFILDKGTTTIDGGDLSFDNLYRFTVRVADVLGTVSSDKEFTIRVNNYNKVPYENIYLKALPTLDQRLTFLEIVNNTEIFPENLIYRSRDFNFGRARDIRSLFLAGLSPTQVDTYATAMQTNTYNKRIEFSDVKTAQAVDANFNVKYEVVYIELHDDEIYKGNSPANYKYNPYISANVYPNSFANMSSVITNATGYANQGALPEWMTSPQADKKTLGFTRAVVLAYTVPGASKLIAYRLHANGIAFNSINFVADRYDLDHSYTKNYNTVTKKFTTSNETTFDRIQRTGAVQLATSYGVSGLAFDMINGQTVASINARGVTGSDNIVRYGLDGVTNFTDGQTLIFVQQENYPGETHAADGWIKDSAILPGYIEYNNNTPIADGTSGFPSGPTEHQTAVVGGVVYFFTNYNNQGTLITPGVWRTANLRASVWRINISASNIVTLTFNQLVFPGNRVQINRGATRSSTIVYYDTALKSGNTVPAYTLIPTQLSPSNTRFDSYGTKFFSNKDSYTVPGDGDAWLKFPKQNVLQ